MHSSSTAYSKAIAARAIPSYVYLHIVRMCLLVGWNLGFKVYHEVPWGGWEVLPEAQASTQEILRKDLWQCETHTEQNFPACYDGHMEIGLAPDYTNSKSKGNMFTMFPLPSGFIHTLVVPSVGSYTRDFSLPVFYPFFLVSEWFPHPPKSLAGASRNWHNVKTALSMQIHQ